MKFIEIKSEKFPSLEKLADIINLITTIVLFACIMIFVFTGQFGKLLNTPISELKFIDIAVLIVLASQVFKLRQSK